MKGNLSIPTVILIGTLGTVGFFGNLMANDALTNSVTYNSGDYNTIAKSKVKADAYSYRMPKEVNYSSNIVALNQQHRWDVGEIPKVEEINESIKNSISSSIGAQNRVRFCEGPTVDDIELKRLKEGLNITVKRNQPFIQCETDSTKSRIDVKDEITVENSNNNVFNMTPVIRKLGKNASGIIKEYDNPSEEPKWDWAWATGESSCADYSLDENDGELAEETAISNAKDNVEEKYSKPNIGAQSTQKIDIPGYMELEKETNYEVRTQDVGGFPKQKDCTCDSSSEEDSSDSDGSEDECSKTKFVHNVTEAPSNVQASFTLKDVENEIINSDGVMSNIEYDASVGKDLDPDSIMSD